MIHIDFGDSQIELNGKKTYRFALTVSGHALSDDPGKDLVCCAVSTLVGTLFAALDEQEIACEAESDQEAGYADLNVEVGELEMPTVYIMYMTIMIGLLQVADDYPEYVSIHKKEVK